MIFTLVLINMADANQIYYSILNSLWTLNEGSWKI